MRKLKLLWKILKITSTDKIVSGFIVFIFLASLGIQVVEPNILSYSDALWYAFISFTTIGFGDIVAVTFLGRMLTVMISLYGILIVGLIPGILVSYFTEATRIKTDETVIMFLDKLENLPSLSKEELENISNNVKKRRYQL